MNGSDSYLITFNEQLIRTTKDEITLDLVQSRNTITVKTNIDCQGVYEEIVLLDNIPMVYPNPIVNNNLFINPGFINESEVTIQIFSLTGNLNSSNSYSPNRGRIDVDASSIPRGIFILKITP